LASITVGTIPDSSLGGDDDDDNNNNKANDTGHRNNLLHFFLYVYCYNGSFFLRMETVKDKNQKQ